MEESFAKPLVTPSDVDGRFAIRQDRIKSIETFLVKPRWLFLKMTTEEGIVGLGEPILEGRALTCQTAVKELEPWLIYGIALIALMYAMPTGIAGGLAALWRRLKAMRSS